MATVAAMWPARRLLGVLALAVGACASAGPATDSSVPTRSASPSTVVTTTTTTSAVPITIGLRLERRTTDAATADFAAATMATLLDERGWKRAGFAFEFTDDAPYVVVLAEADEVDQLCRPYDTGGRFSCQNGPVVALNADRWRTAVPSWPDTVERYRQMLVNHEVGHLLGRHHARPGCDGGGPAAVMFQQSGGLGDCDPNPWPLAWEIDCAARHDEPIAPPFEDDATATCGVDG